MLVLPLGLAAGAAPPPAHSDAEMLALCAELERLERAYLALFSGPDAIADDDARDAAVDAIMDERHEAMLSRLCAIPCASPEGMLAKLRLLGLMLPEVKKQAPDGGYFDRRLLGSLLRDASAGA